MSNDDWESGIIKKWFDDKGYGFVELASSGKDSFLHITTVPSDLKDTIKVGDQVEVVSAQDKKGLRVMKLRYPF